MENQLAIRYVKLKFRLKMTEDTRLPVYKASAIRGGIGEMLMQQHCICNRVCTSRQEQCGFWEECIVQRMMYSSMSQQPEFMGRGNSVGYVIECENYKTEFPAGSLLRFQLLLFGKNIVYFSQYLQAIHMLGKQGLGKDAARYTVVSIQNGQGQELLHGNEILLKNYHIEFVSDYVAGRMAGIQDKGGIKEIVFSTPVTIKYRGKFIQDFFAEALQESLLRRIYILNCFEHADAAPIEIEEPFPSVTAIEVKPVSVPRYSFRKQEKVILKGIAGRVRLESVSDQWLWLLCAGEILHIGKNTSFGFGRYQVE